MIVAAPVVGRRFTIVGRGRQVAYGDDAGFIAVVTVEPPLLPNGLQVGRLPAVGDEVVADGEVWDPTLRIVGAELVADGPEDLLRAVETRDPSLAAAAGARLIGRGGGLTPEGDDLVAGVAAVVASSAWPRALRGAWLGALVGDDPRRRTTALSATLLELAVRGMGPEPLQALLAGDASALPRLEALGHSTGRAYARGAAVGLCNLRVTHQPEVVPMQIERETLIAAPVERVWALLTEAEHVGRWFCDDGAEIDLRPGGTMVLRWAEHGVGRARIVDVERPHRFSYRWAAIREHWGEEPDDGNSTLVEFTLEQEGDQTRLRVTESGFEKLDGTDEQRRGAFEGNTEGWEIQLGNVKGYSERVPA